MLNLIQICTIDPLINYTSLSGDVLELHYGFDLIFLFICLGTDLAFTYDEVVGQLSEYRGDVFDSIV